VFGEHARIELYSPASGICFHWLGSGGGFRSDRAMRLIALSGRVSEEFAIYGLFQEDAALSRAVTPDALSTSDRIHSGEFTPRDVSECAALVRSDWANVAQLAADTINRCTAAWDAQ
jgi:hypothetical protein